MSIFTSSHLPLFVAFSKYCFLWTCPIGRFSIYLDFYMNILISFSRFLGVCMYLKNRVFKLKSRFLWFFWISSWINFRYALSLQSFYEKFVVLPEIRFNPPPLMWKKFKLSGSRILDNPYQFPWSKIRNVLVPTHFNSAMSNKCGKC